MVNSEPVKAELVWPRATRPRGFDPVWGGRLRPPAFDLDCDFVVALDPAHPEPALGRLPLRMPPARALATASTSQPSHSPESFPSSLYFPPIPPKSSSTAASQNGDKIAPAP